MSEKQHRKTKKQQKQRPIKEEAKIAISLAIKKLLESPEKDLAFPTSLGKEERAYIHKVALELGLKSKSRGKGTNRYITVYKKDELTIIRGDAVIRLQDTSKQSIHNMLCTFPLSQREWQELLPPIERVHHRRTDVNTSTKAMGRLNNSVPQVPHLRTNYDVLNFRKSLPIFSARDDIIWAMNSGQVVIIASETGSGKTTQVPQFILEFCQQMHQPCRIICTQPRRISAVSVAERVAYERDEKIGQTFGYQIRLESRVGPKTLLTFCTNGVLLRTLMGGDSALSTVTHIIVDEVHERDRFCDFLLISLRDAVMKYKHLKVVLMSATMDTSIFANYFNNCAVINVPGRCYDVERYYLEDVLKITGYMTKEMIAQKKELKNKKEQQNALDSWTRYRPQHPDEASGNRAGASAVPVKVEEKIVMEPWLIEEMDRVISEAWLSGGVDNFAQLLHCILSENVSVDYQHSQTSVTALMVSAGRGYIDMVQQLINLGANLYIQAHNEWTALDWAKNMNELECAELIEAYMKVEKNAQASQQPLQDKDPALSQQDQMLLDVYQQTFNDEGIDYDLLLHLILYIHRNMPFGSLLIFLPGYDDIVTMRDKINNEEQKMNQDMRYTLYILHSKMQTSDQKKVFKPSALGTRKIILSTNIAETSITIDDVVYVIDSGKIKEKSFDALSGVCTLQSNWISQACAKQRSGRAGRCRKGICYHLFSSMRYNSLQPYQTPEILRLPLQELCLYTKHLAPGNKSIAEFLDRALEPPSNIVTRNAVQLLKTIDALDPWEDLTELGRHLLDLPVEPRYGKMLLYAVVLKCLDPVLTIVCSLAYNDPFILPAQPALKKALSVVRKKFAMDAYSDHMAVLRAFQGWQNARASGMERSFCEQNFISPAVMEMVVGMRTQLLGQLRASGFVRARGVGDIRDLNTNSENWAVVKAALTAGLYPNLIRMDRAQMKLRTQKESKVLFHPSSTLKEAVKCSKTTATKAHSTNLKSFPTDWLLYEEMSRAGRVCHAKMVTLVTPLTVALFSGPARLPPNVLEEVVSAADSDSDSDEDASEGMIFKLDNWVEFKLDADTAQLFLHLRQKWNALFLRRMKAPGKTMSQLDERVISTLVAVITNEEKVCGLQQPTGIGQRPRPLIVDYYPVNN